MHEWWTEWMNKLTNEKNKAMKGMNMNEHNKFKKKKEWKIKEGIKERMNDECVTEKHPMKEMEEIKGITKTKGMKRMERMNDIMNEWTNTCMKGEMNEAMKPMSEWINDWIHVWKKKWKKQWNLWVNV